MGIEYSPKITTNGLVLCLDPANLIRHGSSPYKSLTSTATITNNSFLTVDNIFRSDCFNSPIGNSFFAISGMVLDTGSVTVQWFMNMTSNPNVDGNNNWRRLIANPSGDRIPFGFVLEQGGQINFTLQTTTGNKRHINNNFTPTSVALNEWNMITYTYDRNSGLATCYKNDQLVLQGPQTAGSVSPTTPGEAMVNLSGSNMVISNNNTASGGDACLPCDLGPWLIYTRALSNLEIQQNFQAFRGRYGI
jgi:hypothetical protein